MPRTFFQDFTKDDGSPVTVEYTFASGSETTYSPAFGAVGGDPCEVSIVNSWPNTPRYHETYELRHRRKEHMDGLRYSDDLRALDEELDAEIARDEEAAQLTDAERERMEAWLCEHHVDEPDDDIEF